MRYMYGDSLSSLSMASSHPGEISLFSLAHAWQVEVKLRAPIYLYTEHAQFVNVS